MSFCLRLLAVLALCLGMPALQALPAEAGLAHNLTVRLLPEEHRLVGRDQITIPRAFGPWISLTLAPEADIRSLTLNGAPALFSKSAREVRVAVPPANRKAKLEIGLEYAAVFKNPVPKAPPTWTTRASG